MRHFFIMKVYNLKHKRYTLKIINTNWKCKCLEERAHVLCRKMAFL